MSKLEPVTYKETKWIEDFKKLAKSCPKKLWLFSASGTLCVMKTPEDGNERKPDGGVDSDCIIDTINIRNDGGGW